jgi:hypothetical protein
MFRTVLFEQYSFNDTLNSDGNKYEALDANCAL